MMSLHGRRVRAMAALAAGLVALAGTVGAQTPVPAAAGPGVSTGASTSSSAPIRPARPYWIELTLAERQALAPLADDWERLDFQTKKKWVGIANRYPRMSPEDQARTQQRMREWALLTPDQRRVARDSFARVRQMPPEQRAEMLRKYQELPPERREALATEGRSHKAIVVPKPPTTPAPRRAELSEGAKASNPAVAAQKGASPLIAPARPAPAAVPAAQPSGAPVAPGSTGSSVNGPAAGTALPAPAAVSSPTAAPVASPPPASPPASPAASPPATPIAAPPATVPAAPAATSGTPAPRAPASGGSRTP